MILSVILLLTTGAHKGNQVNPTRQHNEIRSCTLPIAQTVSTEKGLLKYEDRHLASEKSLNTGLLIPERVNDFSYLRFDVNEFITESDLENAEMPEQEFNYLKFDVNTFTETNQVDSKEMPVNEFDYLRFDVNRFIDAESINGDTSSDIPATD